MTDNCKEVMPTSEECEEYLNQKIKGVRAVGTSVGAGTFLRRCNPAEFRLRKEQMPPFVCIACDKRHQHEKDAANCCVVKVDTNKSTVDFRTEDTITTLVLKGCVYLYDNFQANPNLISIQFKDLGLEFYRNQFKL